MCGGIIAVVLCFVIGLILLFDKDLAWRMQKGANDSRGLVSQKPEDWGVTTTLSGCGFIFLSAMFIFFMLIIGN